MARPEAGSGMLVAVEISVGREYYRMRINQFAQIIADIAKGELTKAHELVDDVPLTTGVQMLKNWQTPPTLSKSRDLQSAAQAATS